MAQLVRQGNARYLEFAEAAPDALRRVAVGHAPTLLIACEHRMIARRTPSRHLTGGGLFLLTVAAV